MGLLRLLLSPFRGAVWLYVVLALFFFAVGGIAILLGYGFEDVDNWIAANGGWIEAIGNLLFRLFCGVVLLFCALIVAMVIYEAVERIRGRRTGAASRKEESFAGLGCGAVIAAAIGYFAWFGTFY